MSVSNECIEELSKIGEENNESAKFSAGTISINKNEAEQMLKNWLKGLGISLVPLIILPLYRLMFDEEIQIGILTDFLINAEFLFVGVSLMITSLNDFVKADFKKSDVTGSLGILIVGAALYVMRIIGEHVNSSISIVFPIVLNVAFLTVVIATSLYFYIKAIKEGA